MSAVTTIRDRNRPFASDFVAADLPILSRLRAVVLTCGRARVDPAHVLGLDLGDAVVIRNNGGRVTEAVVEEIATLAFIGAKMDGPEPSPFELIIMQHTQCGAERFANAEFQQVLEQQTGVDVSSIATADHEQSLREDVERCATRPKYPDTSSFRSSHTTYETARVREVVAPATLASSQPPFSRRADTRKAR